MSSGRDYRLRGPLPALAIPSTLQDSLMARLDRAPRLRVVANYAVGHDNIDHAAAAAKGVLVIQVRTASALFGGGKNCPVPGVLPPVRCQ